MLLRCQEPRAASCAAPALHSHLATKTFLCPPVTAGLGLLLWRRHSRSRVRQAAAEQQPQEWVPPGQEALRPGRLTMQFSSQEDEVSPPAQAKRQDSSAAAQAKQVAASDGKIEAHSIVAVHVIADGGAAAGGLIPAGGQPASVAGSPDPHSGLAAGLMVPSMDAAPSAPPAPPGGELFAPQAELAGDAADIAALALELEQQEMLLQQELALLLQQQELAKQQQQQQQQEELAALEAQLLSKLQQERDTQLAALEAQLVSKLQQEQQELQELQALHGNQHEAQHAQQLMLEQAQQSHRMQQLDAQEHGEQREQQPDLGRQAQQEQPCSDSPPEHLREPPADEVPTAGTVTAMLQVLQQALGSVPPATAAGQPRRALPPGVLVHAGRGRGRVGSAPGRGGRHGVASSGSRPRTIVAAEPQAHLAAHEHGRAQPPNTTGPASRDPVPSSTSRAGLPTRGSPYVQHPVSARRGAARPDAWPAPPPPAGTHTGVGSSSTAADEAVGASIWQSNPMAGSAAAASEQEERPPQHRLRRMSSVLRARGS